MIKSKEKKNTTKLAETVKRKWILAAELIFSDLYTKFYYQIAWNKLIKLGLIIFLLSLSFFKNYSNGCKYLMSEQLAVLQRSIIMEFIDSGALKWKSVI